MTDINEDSGLVKVGGNTVNAIRIKSRGYFDLVNPDPAMINREDIAASLSKICRFGGHCHKFYSVAEHSILSAQAAIDFGLSTEAVLAVLLHDAAEAYVGDMVRPLKSMMPGFKSVERKVQDAISKKFSVDFDTWKQEIHEIDFAMVIAERGVLFSPDGCEWEGEKEALVIHPKFQFSLPAEAEFRFLHMWESINRSLRFWGKE